MNFLSVNKTYRGVNFQFSTQVIRPLFKNDVLITGKNVHKIHRIAKDNRD